MRTPTTNWTGRLHFTPARVVRAISEQEVAEQLARATRAGAEVRPIGSGHSFSPLAVTPGVMVTVTTMSGLVGMDEQTGEVTLWAGTPMRDIGGLLAPFGRALPTMGDVDAQTIAGAISTGTHGTGLAHVGYSAQVTGLRLALPSGDLVDVDAEQDPELFQAARVGLGLVGIITQVRLRTVPAFNLASEETTEPVESLLEGFLERARTTDHLEFFWFPGTTRATVKQHRRLAPDEDVRPLTRLDRVVQRELLANRVYGAMCAAASRSRALAGPTREVASRFMAGKAHSDASHRVFVASRGVRFDETEYAMPLEAFDSVVREVERAIVASGEQVTFPFEVRLAAADDTWLGAASGRESVYVAVHRYHRDDFDALLNVVEPVFTAHEGRPHWGKRHTLGADQLRALYPRFDDFRAVRERVDPTGVLLNDHTRHLVGGFGRPLPNPGV